MKYDSLHCTRVGFKSSQKFMASVHEQAQEPFDIENKNYFDINAINLVS